MARMVLKGGDKLAKALADISKKVQKGAKLRVGFLEGATYPDGTSVAYVASIQEFGAKVEVEAGQQTIYRSIAKDGSFNKNGKFVKASKSNFATTHDVAAHEIVIPPRPFMRTTISDHQETWGTILAEALDETDYDANMALNALGEVMSDQVRDTMDKMAPPNAASTIKKKGFDKPLIDTGHMLNSVGYEVSDD